MKILATIAVASVVGASTVLVPAAAASLVVWVVSQDAVFVLSTIMSVAGAASATAMIAGRKNED